MSNKTLPKNEIEELADILMGLQRSFMFSLSKELAKGKISFAQFFLLGHLQQAGFVTMSAIAEKMGHTTAAATGLVDRLERLRYVQRAHDKTDRRKVMVSINKKGVALVERVREEMVTGLKDIMGNLSGEEQSGWLSTYRKIRDLCNAK